MKPNDSLPLMTWRARPDMACEDVSPAWLDFTGLSLDQARGDGWARALHPEDLARWLDACVRAFDGRRAFEIEYRLRRRDGEYRWVLDRAAPRYAGESLFVGYDGVCIDIDEHMRVQHGLVRALQELQSPAQAIAAWAGHLRSQVPPAAEAARALEAIERNARTQSRIISNLLDAAYADSEKRAHGQVGM
jgi:PAS domain S-box-containing protein